MKAMEILDTENNASCSISSVHNDAREVSLNDYTFGLLHSPVLKIHFNVPPFQVGHWLRNRNINFLTS